MVAVAFTYTATTLPLVTAAHIRCVSLCSPSNVTAILPIETTVAPKSHHTRATQQHPVNVTPIVARLSMSVSYLSQSFPAPPSSRGLCDIGLTGRSTAAVLPPPQTDWHGNYDGKIPAVIRGAHRRQCWIQERRGFLGCCCCDFDK